MPNRHHLGFSPLWLRLYPELRLFESRAQVRDADRAWAGRGRTFNKRMLATLLVVVLVAAALGAVLRVTLLNAGAPTWVAPVLNALLVLLFTFSVSVVVWYRPYTRFLRGYLNEHGVPVCMRCGYDLRGLTDPRCPECGKEFDATLLGAGDGEQSID